MRFLRYSEKSQVWRAGAVLPPGELVDQKTLEDGRVQHHYRMTTPHPVYLTTLVVGDYVTLEDTWRGRPVRYVVEPVDEERARRSFGKTPDMLEFFSGAWPMARIRVPSTPWDPAPGAPWP